MQWIQVLLFITLNFVLDASASLSDPYKLLRVKRTATTQEIRRAYKQQAKEWHPDKSDDPAAEARFVEIKQAYEILSDPDRRKMYDQHGITDEDSAKQKQDYSYYNRFSMDPLDELFGTHGGRFHFQDHDITFFHKMSVTTRQYENNLVPKSQHIPHLVLFYTDWCFSCLQAAPMWRRLVDTLEPLGVALVTVHAGRESTLARKIGVPQIPGLVLLLDGKNYVFKEGFGSAQRIVEFVRGKLPYKMVPVVDDGNVEDFLNGWADNRVRGLIFERQNTLRLRYLVTAFHFRDRVAFGFVRVKSADSAGILHKYKITGDIDTVLLFNENPSRPMASVSMQEIPSQTLHHVIGSNQYLVLPRLSSQQVLEELCPAEWNRPRKRLCVILVTENTAEHDKPRQALRQFAEESHYSVERVRFVYLYHERQTEFVDSLITDGSPDEPLLKIVIIWRRDTTHIKYEWLTEPWSPDNDTNDTERRLEETIGRLLKSSEALTYEAVVKDLLDEHARGIFARIVMKLLIMADIVYEGMTTDQILPAVSIIGTVVFIIAAGYFMAYLVRLEEESIQRQMKGNKRNGNNNNETGEAEAKPLGQQRELYLHELRAEKYNGLVRLLKPGCRTIVLIVDVQSRFQLIPAFHRIVWPYRKNKTLMFAHMSLERGLTWYKELLQLSLPEPRELNINPRNCIGTVLSLNGHRKYFCMFHAKHNESRLARRRQQLEKKNEDPELGAFIGFETDSSETDDEEVLLQGDLLDALPNWLDRLFEGTTRRYYINYWPDFPTK